MGALSQQLPLRIARGQSCASSLRRLRHAEIDPYLVECLLIILTGIKVRLDKGSQGSEKAAPQVDVQMPCKQKRGQERTAFEKAYNHLLSVLRIPVEHHFARLKKFGCLAGRWRGPHQTHEDLFCIVSGLLNLHAGRPPGYAGKDQ